jgi:hypothetical protein
MNAESFRVDFFRLPFLVLFAALVVWVIAGSLQAGALAAVVALSPVALGAAVAWFFGIVQVGPQGFVLYRTHAVQWAEVTKVEPATVLGLPHLRVWRSSGMAWFVPLYVKGPRSITESFMSWAPPENSFRAVLAQRGGGSSAP